MGSAKLMIALGEFGFYSPDYQQFAKQLGKLFQTNICASFFDTVKANNRNYSHIEEECFDMGFPDLLLLHVDFYYLNNGPTEPNNQYGVYELKIPVDLPFTSELNLTFYPGGIFELGFLPFNNLWKFFVEDIKGLNDKYSWTHEQIVSNIMNIRNCYIEILQNINCKEVIIWATAASEAIDKMVYSSIFGSEYTLGSLKEEMQKQDGISMFPFISSLKKEIELTSISGDYLDIAFNDIF